jgi:hypothetical protein
VIQVLLGVIGHDRPLEMHVLPFCSASDRKNNRVLASVEACLPPAATAQPESECDL